MAFSIEERQILGIHGLLPAAVKTQEEQLELCRLNLDRYTDDLSKYIYLTSLLVCINEIIISLNKRKQKKNNLIINNRIGMSVCSTVCSPRTWRR